MKRVIVLLVVLSSIGLVGWASSSQATASTEYSAVIVALAAAKPETQAEAVSTELNKRAAEGWAPVTSSTFVGETGRPAVLLVLSRPVK